MSAADLRDLQDCLADHAVTVAAEAARREDGRLTAAALHLLRAIGWVHESLEKAA